MLSITQLVTNPGGEGTGVDDIHHRGAFQDRPKLALKRPAIPRGAPLQPVDDSFLEIPDQYG